MSNYPILEFHNALKSQYSFDLIAIEELLNNTYKNHSPFHFHQIEFFAFILYNEGEEMHTIDFAEYPCERGTLLAIRKGQIHKFSKAISKGYILAFNYDFLGSIFTKGEAQKSLLLFNEFLYEPKIQLNETEYQTVLKIANQIKEESIRKKDTFSSSIVRSLLQVFINQVYRFKIINQSKKNNKKYLTTFIQFQNLIEKHYTETLKVKDYAAWLGVQTKQLNVVTKNIVNKTAKEFIDEVCINNIKRMLMNSNKSIKEISYDSGFEETTNFNNYFKKRVGKTPLAYKNH